MERLATQLPFALFLFFSVPARGAQEPKALPLPDERYKVDILLVAAHPDDEGAATPYLARALDEHKRIAVVFGTRGSSGANEAGAEQAAALGAVREIEARNALATLGITNRMVSRWQGHGVAKCIAVAGELGSRRITGAIGQAREAHAAGSDSHISSGNFYWRRPRRPPSFRRAGNRSVRSGGRPSCVAEQVAGPTKRLEPYLENLRPWEPKRFITFRMRTAKTFFAGKARSTP